MEEEIKVTLAVTSEQNLIAKVHIREKSCDILRQLRDEGRGIKEIIAIANDLNYLTSCLF